jgi:hypothetical protein
MGDRALIVFTDVNTISPGVYLHWNGHNVPAMIAALADLMKGRENDAGYACARFTGIAHSMISGNLSLGMWNISPAEQRAILTKNEAKLKRMSPGDAGLIVVDTKDFSYAVYDGYTQPWVAA